MNVQFSNYLKDSKPLLRQLLEELGKEYAYVSILGTDCRGRQYMVQKSGVTVGESRWTERGFVVRVYLDKQYAEYSFNQLNPDNLFGLVQTIHAACYDTFKKISNVPVETSDYPLIEEEAVTQSFSGEAKLLPETMRPEEKIARLSAIKDQALAASPLLVDFRVRYEEVEVSKVFLSKKKDLEQSYLWSQGYLTPIVRRNGKTKFAYQSFSGLSGPELLDEMACGIDTAIARAERLLDAEPVQPGEYDVICSPEVAGLIAHEAFGHGVELDMFVKKRAKAQDYLGKQVASELVEMHDGAAAAHQVSAYLFDDEGTLASDTTVITHGILQSGISDLLSALKLKLPPTGNGKRESFERKAYARMTHTFFTKGTDRLEDMIASIKYGYLLDGAMSGMEDPKNWGIQCMILQGEEIRDGQLTGKIVAPVIMTGYVPDLLQAITMVSEDFKLYGSGACGKGHKEWVKVADGGPFIKTKARLG